MIFAYVVQIDILNNFFLYIQALNLVKFRDICEKLPVSVE